MRYAKSAPAVSSPDGTAGGDYRACAALLDGKAPLFAKPNLSFRLLRSVSAC